MVDSGLYVIVDSAYAIKWILHRDHLYICLFKNYLKFENSKNWKRGSEGWYYFNWYSSCKGKGKFSRSAIRTFRLMIWYGLLFLILFDS